MPTNRRVLSRPRRQLDEFEYSELLTLREPLLGGYGFNGQVDQMEKLWREREAELINLWTSGWRPETEFAGFPDKAGRPGTRPPAWWLFCAPHKRKRGEHEWMYLDRYGLWRDGERDEWLAACSEGKNGRITLA